MRLRQLILALIALAGVWVGVLVQRTHHGSPAAAFASGPQPADFPAPKLVHVAGLKRPAAQTPIVAVARARRQLVSAPAHASFPHPPSLAHSTKVMKRHAPEPPNREEEVPDSGRSYADAPPPPLEPLEITDAQVVGLTSSSARITWRTNVPTQTQTSFGLDAPTIWTEPGGDSVIEHESVVSGLEFSTTYTIYLHAVDEWNRAATQTVTVTTGPMLSSSAARTSGDQIWVDDRPFFPTAVWAQCSDMFGSNIDDGINLFMGDGCTNDGNLAARLDGRAYSIVSAEDAAQADGRGVIGWYFPDEWDAFLKSSVKRADLEKEIPEPRAGRISFLTLTNHFYSKAAPLPEGKGMYPVLYSIPDVLGFDLYPLQVWCRPAFGDVFDAQHELQTASGGKPTFQWIEVARMEQPCKKQPELDPTPATVRAETWLSVAGGANAVGYFPNHWTRDIGAAIAGTNRQLKALTQALLAPDAAAQSNAEAVRVSARALNGALYVIAVNTSETTVQAKITVDGIAGRSATVLGTGQAVGADDQGFTDTFGPLDARVYVVPPPGW